MKVYKDGLEANADKDQLPAMKAAGWSRTPPKVEEKESDTSGYSGAEGKNRKVIKKRKISKKD